MKRVIFIFAAIFFLFSSCAVRKTTEGEKVIVIEPTTTKADTIKVTKVDTTAKIESQDTVSAVPAQVSHGWRVQIFAFSERSRAEIAYQDAKLRLSLPVYLEYVPSDPTPHKIRVGNFLTREEAERYRDFLRQNGYPDAFLVESQIELK